MYICRPEFNIRCIPSYFSMFFIYSLRISMCCDHIHPLPLTPYPPKFIFSFSFKNKENKQPYVVRFVLADLLLGIGPALCPGVWLT